VAESGGQPGNQNAVKSKRWYAAIDRALAKRCKGDGIKALDELAEKLLANAEAGDMSALKELGDRLDGKAAQAIINAEGENFRIEAIQRVIVDAATD
jgi:hypothetical protein